MEILWLESRQPSLDNTLLWNSCDPRMALCEIEDSEERLVLIGSIPPMGGTAGIVPVIALHFVISLAVVTCVIARIAQ